MSGRCTHLQHISSAWSQKIQKMTVYFTCYNNFSFPLSRWKAHLWPGARWRGGRGDNSEHPSLVNNAQRSEFMWTLFTWWRHRVREKWIHSGACSAFTMQSSRLLYKLFHDFFVHTVGYHMFSVSHRAELLLVIVFCLRFTLIKLYRTVFEAAFISLDREHAWEHIYT